MMFESRRKGVLGYVPKIIYSMPKTQAELRQKDGRIIGLEYVKSTDF